MGPGLGHEGGNKMAQDSMGIENRDNEYNLRGVH